jgi:hypothetical protein
MSEEEKEESLPQVQDIVVRFTLHPDFHADIVSVLWEAPWPDWLVDAKIFCEGRERDATADELIMMGHDADEPENREDI